MTKQWLSVTLPRPDVILNDIRDWCKENCRGRFRVRYTLPRLGGVFIVANFQREADAMAFKLRWL